MGPYLLQNKKGKLNKMTFFLAYPFYFVFKFSDASAFEIAKRSLLSD